MVGSLSEVAPATTGLASTSRPPRKSNGSSRRKRGGQKGKNRAASGDDSPAENSNLSDDDALDLSSQGGEDEEQDLGAPDVDTSAQSTLPTAEDLGFNEIVCAKLNEWTEEERREFIRIHRHDSDYDRDRFNQIAKNQAERIYAVHQ